MSIRTAVEADEDTEVEDAVADNDEVGKSGDRRWTRRREKGSISETLESSAPNTLVVNSWAQGVSAEVKVRVDRWRSNWSAIRLDCSVVIAPSGLSAALCCAELKPDSDNWFISTAIPASSVK
jgi:hypothetical protein